MVPQPTSTLSSKPLTATNIISGFRVRPGLFLLNGANVVPGGVSFTIHSINATYCELCLFHRTHQEPFAVLPFPDNFRIGNTFSMIVFDILHKAAFCSYKSSLITLSYRLRKR